MALKIWNCYPEDEDENRWNDPLPGLIDRYYTKFYCPKSGTEPGVNEDQCVLLHSNKVCVVCIAPTHALVTDPTISIKEINFQFGKLDRSKSQVSGKRKRGGQRLGVSSALCTVHTTDERRFILYSCIKGTLVEINEKLQTDNSLLVQKPLGEGFIAVVIMKLNNASGIPIQLLNEDGYNDCT